MDTQKTETPDKQQDFYAVVSAIARFIETADNDIDTVAPKLDPAGVDVQA